MFRADYLINLYVILVIVMANFDGKTHLDLLFEKTLRYEDHQENFKWCNSFWTLHKNSQ